MAWFVCVGMLGTAVIVMGISLEGKLNFTEIVGMRCGWTIYSGWLTVATILNTGFVLKSYGLDETEMNIDESSWAVATLLAALGVYVYVSYSLRNPLYAGIFIWVLFAIRDEQSSYQNIQTTTEVLLIIHGCYLVGLTVWLVLDKINNAPNEKYGLFY
jgi:hypothetical protein